MLSIFILTYLKSKKPHCPYSFCKPIEKALEKFSRKKISKRFQLKKYAESTHRQHQQI